jgi:Tol biopolymer transport system component
MMRSLLLAASLLACGALVGYAQVTIFDSSLVWQQMEAPHFVIVFHQGLENIAHETATVAEESYEIIQREFGKAPAEKTYIVIADFADSIVGSATPFPQNTIYIGPAQMRLADWANVRLDSWIRMLVYHELLHIMDLDIAMGVNALLRTIFGRIVLPNSNKPITFIEGLAVYEKYKHLGESRLNDANTIMMVRQMVRDNKIPRFDEISRYYTRVAWPPVGLLVYNFSSWFLRYIEETHGPESMKKFNDANSSNLLNVLLGFGSNFSCNLQQALGKSADEVYVGFQSWLHQRFSEEIQAITREGLTASVRLSKLGWGSGQPAWSPDGKEILYRHNGPGRNGIRIISADGQRDREVVFGGGQLPSFSPDSKSLLYTKLDLNGFYYAFSDLYLYDLEKKSERRLTHGARAYAAVFAPDGSTIYFAHHIGHDASTAISKLDLQSGKITPVKEFSDNSATVHSLAVSPDGKTLALSLWKRGGYQDIYLLDLSPSPSPEEGGGQGGRLTPITQDKDEDLDPSFSPDGQYLLFSSDRGEHRVANLYVYKLDDGSFYKVTNVLTGAFDPAVSPDGTKIAFTSYSSEGYDVHLMPYDPANWKPISIQKESIPTWPGFQKTTFPMRPYDPVPSLLPKLWLPVGDEHSVGIVTFGQDVLGRHIYQVVTGWDFAHKRPFYFFDYTLAQILPVISLSLSESRDGSGQKVGLVMPLSLSIQQQQWLGVRYSRSQHPAKAPEHPNLWTEDVYSAQYSYQSARGSGLWRDTLSVSVKGQLESPSDGKSRRRLTVTLSEVFRLPLVETHTLMLKFVGGWSDAERTEDGFSIGGSTGEFALRGFAEKTQQGKQALVSTVEYRFPLFTIEHGLGYWPIFFDDVGGSIFLDMGLAGDTLDVDALKLGFGAEINLSLTTGYFFNWAFRVGVAQGLGEPSPRFYLALGL